MGLNVIDDVVDVDHSHNRLLSTGLHGNPAVGYIPGKNGALTVYSVFRRHKAPNSSKQDRSTSRRGDNCHLLYALKDKDGLSTTFGAIRRLMLHFDAIVEQIVDQSGKFDAIVPMPSGHAISRIFADRLSRRYGCPVADNMFKKISWDQARQQVGASPLSSPERRKVMGRLEHGAGDFALKVVPTNFREHFSPLTLDPAFLPAGYTKFLLADDLLATGRTLASARDEILAVVAGSSVAASCVFSGV
jgi:hypothetical protein